MTKSHSEWPMCVLLFVWYSKDKWVMFYCFSSAADIRLVVELFKESQLYCCSVGCISSSVDNKFDRQYQ